MFFFTKVNYLTQLQQVPLVSSTCIYCKYQDHCMIIMPLYILSGNIDKFYNFEGATPAPSVTASASHLGEFNTYNLMHACNETFLPH